jgi:hypothetical protein
MERYNKFSRLRAEAQREEKEMVLNIIRIIPESGAKCKYVTDISTLADANSGIGQSLPVSSFHSSEACR